MMTPFRAFPVRAAINAGAAFVAVNARIPADVATEILNVFEWILNVDE